MHSHPLTDLHKIHPIIHCITNYVTANDCANILLAAGASPVMADAPEEAAEITAGAQALVLNLGTLSERRLAAMLAAGKQANAMDIPVVFDPVGVSASAFRRNAAAELLSQIRFTVIRGNLSEIRYLADTHETAAGVDAQSGSAEQALSAGTTLARNTGSIVTVSGTEDIVTDGTDTYKVSNGHPVLRQITGAGCMLSVLIGAFLTVDRSAEGCTAAVCAMGLAGETAASRLTVKDGNATCRNHLIDAVYRMTDAMLWRGADFCKQR